MRPDLTVIVGGGLAGVTSAWELGRRGVPVLLLDAHPQLSMGASFANGGMLTASMSDPWNGPGAFQALVGSLFDPYAALKLRLHALPSLTGWGLKFLANSTRDKHALATRNAYRLARRSLELTDQLGRELNIAYDAASKGTLKVFATRAAAEGPIALAERLRADGLRFEVLDRAGVIAVEPELEQGSENFACGLYYPDDASGDARAFTLGLADKARQAGVRIMTETRVKRILVEGGRISGVMTDREAISATRVVIASGTASPALTRPLGVGLAIKPAKGYSVTIPTEGWSDRPGLAVVDDVMHAAIAPIGDVIRLAGTAEFAGVDRTLDLQRIDNLHRIFARLYPHLAAGVDPAKVRPWTELRPMSADGLPFIGPAGPDGLWINAGHGHLGWTLAAGSAELLADLVTGAPPALEARPFRADR